MEPPWGDLAQIMKNMGYEQHEIQESHRKNSQHQCFPNPGESGIRAEALGILPLSLESNVPTPPDSVQENMTIHPASLEGRIAIHPASESEPLKSQVLMQVMVFCTCKLCSIWKHPIWTALSEKGQIPGNLGHDCELSSL